MSIRLRLTVWHLVVLCLGMAVFAAAVLWQVERSAEDSLDQALRQRAADVQADMTVGKTIVLKLDALNLTDHDLGAISVWIRVLDARGNVVLLQGPTVLLSASTDLNARMPGIYTVESAHGGKVRMFVRSVVVNGKLVATIQILTTKKEIDDFRTRLLVAMGLAGALIVVLAAVGGFFLADRALRPVDRITRLADSIGEGDLHRRVSETLSSSGSRRRGSDELHRLATTFDRMLARLEEARERRLQVTADVAHELNTPIATIASGTEIALRRPRETAEYEALLRHILDESRHMGKVVEDLLVLARVDEGRLSVQQELVELDELCRQAARALAPLAAERGVQLKIAVPDHAVVVFGDDLRLMQVLRNILHNALRFSPDDGVVRIALADSGNAGNSIEIRVEDSGPGIAVDEREHIFERYQRASRSVRSATSGTDQAVGSGLGLAICKTIVVAHGGTIHVESANGGPVGVHNGSAFIVRLPRARAQNSRD